MKNVIIFAFMTFILGCSSTKTKQEDGIVILVGYIPNFVMQHPIVTDGFNNQDQFYFDVDEKQNSTGQIIVVYDIRTEIPKEKRRKIEITGTLRSISFSGGKVGKSTYSNNILTLKNWKYLD